MINEANQYTPPDESSAPTDKGSRSTVIAAMGANLAIAVSKFAAAAYTGSSSMLAEAIHSLVDTANEGFLLHGIHRSKRPPDDSHPFGYGAEVYFWSFVVAILIFALGAGFSFYEGAETLISGEPHGVDSPLIALAVLGAASLFEGHSWRVALGQFNAQRRGEGFFRDFHTFKDPTVFIVLFEDSAALLGILIAAAGIGLSWCTGNAVFDAIGSLLVGLLLAITSILLAIEAKELLIGERADPALEQEVRRLLGGEPEIVGVNTLKTLHIGPNDILLAASLDFADDVASQRIERLVSDLHTRIRQQFAPRLVQIYIEIKSAG